MKQVYVVMYDKYPMFVCESLKDALHEKKLRAEKSGCSDTEYSIWGVDFHVHSRQTED